MEKYGKKEHCSKPILNRLKQDFYQEKINKNRGQDIILSIRKFLNDQICVVKNRSWWLVGQILTSAEKKIIYEAQGDNILCLADRHLKWLPLHSRYTILSVAFNVNYTYDLAIARAMLYSVSCRHLFIKYV